MAMGNFYGDAAANLRYKSIHCKNCPKSEFYYACPHISE